MTDDDWQPDPPTDEELALWLKEARSHANLHHIYTIWQRRVEILIAALRDEREKRQR